MNNRRTAPSGQTNHMLSAILAKVNNIEKLLSPAVENLPDSEILDSKGVRLLTKMSSKWLEVVDVTAANQGILMNRFSGSLSVPAFTVEEEANWFWARTYAGDRYNFADGTFKPDGKTDMSDVASYFTATTFDFETGKKAAAFNFFANRITGYGKTDNAPKLAFVFKTGDTGVSIDRRFLVISGYAKTENSTDGTTDVPAGKGGYLINLNLSTLNNGQGILVDTDPTIPEGVLPEPGGGEDLENENVNVIVRVEVKPWAAVNVYPII